MSGVESTGFVSRTYTEILEEIKTSLRADLGQNLELTVDSPEGQLAGVFAAALSEIWGLAKAVYDTWDPAAATGASLENIASISGTTKRSATKSTVTATLNVDSGRTVVAGSIVSVANSPASRFVLLEDVVNSGGAAADLPASFEAQVTGAVVANAGTLTVIETPVTGWNSVTNAADAAVGTAVESDESLRLRRENELSATGSSTRDGIRADILQVTDVLAALVFENDSDAESDGIPARAFEAVVLGGTDLDVATSVANSRPAGIQAHGSTVVSVTDSEGNSKNIGFTRPTTVVLYAEVDISTDQDYPVDGDDQVKEALRAKIASLSIDDDVIITSLYAPILAVAGVTDVTQIRIDTNSSPGSTENFGIGARSIASLDTANITVNAV